MIFFGGKINFAAMLFYSYPSYIVVMTLKFLLRWDAKIFGSLM